MAVIDTEADKQSSLTVQVVLTGVTFNHSKCQDASHRGGSAQSIDRPSWTGLKHVSGCEFMTERRTGYNGNASNSGS